MLRLIYGGFGSGKSTRVNSLIRDAVERKDKYKKCVYLIVPEQDTVRAELEASEGLPASSALSFEVQNFTRLADTVFRSLGGLCYNYANAQSKALCMWQTIRSLGGLISEPMEEADEGRINSMLSVIAELRASGVELGSLERAADELGEESPLGREVKDLSLISTVYEAKLAETYSDSEKDLERLCSVLETNRFFAGCEIFIDGFSSFTAPQLELIKRMLADSDCVTVTLPYDRTRGSYSYARDVEAAARKLTSIAEQVNCTLKCEDMGGSLRGAYEDIRYIADNFYRNGAEPMQTAPEHIEFYDCADAREEAEAVASLIRKKVQEGARYRDIAVVARNAPDYAGILDAAFVRHGIPCFFSSEVRVEAHPIVKLVYGAFALYLKNCRREDVIAYLKTGLCGVSYDECDLFEKYVNSWKINGKRFMSDAPFVNNPNGLTEKMTLSGERVLETANKVKDTLKGQLSAFFAALAKAASVADITCALWDYLSRLNIKDKLYREARTLADGGNEQGAREIEGTYRCFVETLEVLADVVGDECVSVHEYIKLLKLCLRTKTVNVIPTSADAVTVGSAHMLRTSGIRHVFVIGASDGRFPAVVGDRGYFDDVKRNKLSAVGIDIKRDLETEVSKELFYYARAVCAASESVTVSYSIRDVSSSASKISTSTVRLMKLLNVEKPRRFGSLGVLERIYDKAGMIEMAMTAEPSSLDGETRALIEMAKEGRLPAYSLERELAPDVAEEIFGDDMRMSFSRFNSYVLCHFSYLCEYILRLEQTKEYSFDSLDVGNLVHGVLDKITGELLEDGVLLAGVTRSELDGRVERIAGEYLDSVLPEDDMKTARIKSMIGRIRRSVSLMCDDICREFEQSLFSPVGHELQIKEDSPANPAPLEFAVREGLSLVFDGTIDRVDAYKNGGDVYVRVIDYKTGAKHFSLDAVEAGIDLQLLIYLFTLCSQTGKEQKALLGCSETGRILPAGAVYYKAHVDDVEASSPEDEESALKKAGKSLSRCGMLTSDEGILRAMESEPNGMYVSYVKKENKLKAASGSVLCDPERIEEIRAGVENKICSVAGDMRDGKIEAEPLLFKGQVKCRYCRMRAVCRRFDTDGLNEENEGREEQA